MSESANGSQNAWWRRLPFGEVALVAAIVFVLLVATALDSSHSYLAKPAYNARNIMRDTALLGIFAVGAAVVIIAGGIDLSSGSMIALSGTVCACIMTALAPEEMRQLKPVGWPVVLCGVTGALASGLLVGTLHAWLITSIRLPPFVATLATLVGLRSIARALCEFTTFAMAPPDASLTKASLISVHDPIFTWIREHVWAPALAFALLAAVTWIVLNWTVLGRHLHALGGNEQAARLSGIRTENVKWAAYCFASFTAAVAGIFYVANEGVAAPVNQGQGDELNGIAAAVVGGCSLQGGIGTMSGTVLGALFLRVVIDAVGKVIKSGADVFEGTIVGLVVVAAVTFSQIQHVWNSGRDLFGGWLGLASIPVLSIFLGLVVTLFSAPRQGVSAGLSLGVLAFVVMLALLIVARFREQSRDLRR
ncbi:ABC transporter permease [Lignipirellula cremea]|uniref:Ribose transport system permease protein RbsC n=1 Tax=Lignipirellula cremea TaxID=2528010 RepID=A0A518DX21_9BACT|nr:ABC transporter permease [Lignipirellula cremea]QDU96390.1 Ribose transport system permease protein RbsC [Lignipirellula cremea]